MLARVYAPGQAHGWGVSLALLRSLPEITASYDGLELFEIVGMDAAVLH
jgi:hypothetical protein